MRRSFLKLFQWSSARKIYIESKWKYMGCHRSLIVCIDVRHLYQSHRQLSNGASADLLIWSYRGFRGTTHQSHVYEYFIGSWVQVLISYVRWICFDFNGWNYFKTRVSDYYQWHPKLQLLTPVLSMSNEASGNWSDEKSHDILIAACGKVQQHRVHPELLF